MNCKGYKSYMWSYLKNELEDKRIEDLLSHIDSCNECKEELRIQFLVSEGIKRLEADNNSFNLMTDFENRINQSKSRCKQIKWARIIIDLLMIAVILFVVLLLLVSLFV